MWNSQQSNDGIGRISVNAAGRDSDPGTTNDTQRAVSTLTAFQQGSVPNYSYAAQFQMPSVYSTTQDLEYMRRIPTTGIPPYGNHNPPPPPPHLYYQHHRLPYATSRTDDQQHLGYPPMLQPQDTLSNRFGGDQILQRSYSEGGVASNTLNLAHDVSGRKVAAVAAAKVADAEEHTNHAKVVQQEIHLPAPRGKPDAMAIRLAASQVDVGRLAESVELSSSQQNHVVDPGDEKTVKNKNNIALEVVSTKMKKSKSKPPPDHLQTSASMPKMNKKIVGVDAVDAKYFVSKDKLPAKVTSNIINLTEPTKGPVERSDFLLNETVPPISPAEYKNLEAMMTQFCRVPLLAEFSRPVSLLHPEVSLSHKIGRHSIVVDSKNHIIMMCS
jgi:hypothetical protein